jgi:uncharacterized protein YegP (UPF0339 family)
MTRSAQLTHALSAMRKARADPTALSAPATIKLLVFEDNGGGYHWTIVAGSGETLAQSASFASYEDAKQAARIVHAGAASTSFEDLAGDTPPVDLAARRDTPVARDDPDAARWLDEGGSPSNDTVTR